MHRGLQADQSLGTICAVTSSLRDHDYDQLVTGTEIIHKILSNARRLHVLEYTRLIPFTVNVLIIQTP
jgi:hypothetical protein